MAASLSKHGLAFMIDSVVLSTGCAFASSHSSDAILNEAISPPFFLPGDLLFHQQITCCAALCTCTFELWFGGFVLQLSFLAQPLSAPPTMSHHPPNGAKLLAPWHFLLLRSCFLDVEPKKSGLRDVLFQLSRHPKVRPDDVMTLVVFSNPSASVRSPHGLLWRMKNANREPSLSLFSQNKVPLGGSPEKERCSMWKSFTSSAWGTAVPQDFTW